MLPTGPNIANSFHSNPQNISNHGGAVSNGTGAQHIINNNNNGTTNHSFGSFPPGVAATAAVAAAENGNANFNSAQAHYQTAGITAQQVLHKLQTKYLPDLKSLHLECIWLKTNLGLDKKSSGLQSNETRLLQFVQMIDSVVKKIQSFEGRDLSSESPNAFLMLESNIVKTILPVRARLHEKWKENQIDHAGAASSAFSAATAAAANGNGNAATTAVRSAPPKKVSVTGKTAAGGKAKAAAASSGSKSKLAATIGADGLDSSAMGKHSSSNNQLTAPPSAPILLTALPGSSRSSSAKNTSGKGNSTKSGNNNVQQAINGGLTSYQHHQQQQQGPIAGSSKSAKSDKSAANKLPRVSSVESGGSNTSWNQLTGGMGSMNIKSNANSSAQLIPNSSGSSPIHAGMNAFAQLPPQQQQQFYAQQQQHMMMQMMLNAQQAGMMGISPFPQHMMMPAAIGSLPPTAAGAGVQGPYSMNMFKDGGDLFSSDGMLDNNYMLYNDDLDASSLMSAAAIGEVPSSEAIRAINPNPGKRSFNSAMNVTTSKKGSDAAIAAAVAAASAAGTSGGGSRKNSAVATAASIGGKNTAVGQLAIGDNKSNSKKGGSNNTTIKSENEGKVYYRSAVDIDLNPQLNSSLGLSLGEGAVNIKEEEYMSNRRRKRLNQIVPNPRKPRQADYSCSLCGEPYSKTVQENPWWAVYTHECPKCKQEQIPRIDISTTNNAIELDPNIVALYGEGVEDSGGEDDDSDDDDDSGADSGEEGDSGDDESLEDGADVVLTAALEGGSSLADGKDDSGMKRMEVLETAEGSGEKANAATDGAERAAIADGSSSSSGSNSNSNGAGVRAVVEEKPFDGEGLLAQEEASKLLVLMCHARTCTGVHASEKHAEICKSTKYLMLHIRDCKGTDLHGRDCMFPWCRPCKKMLRHLTQCYDPSNCTVCNPWCLPESFQQLRKLNEMTVCQPVSPTAQSNVETVPSVSAVTSDAVAASATEAAATIETGAAAAVVRHDAQHNAHEVFPSIISTEAADDSVDNSAMFSSDMNSS